MTAKKQPAPTSASGAAPPPPENLLKRLQADFDNYRKRTEKERTEIIQFANAHLITEFLPVLDNFKRAAQHIPENLKDDSWIKGMQAIERQFEEILSQLGLTVITPKTGDFFDPIHHEAVVQQGKKESTGKITRTVVPGYKLHNTILKPAKVEIS